MATALPPAPPDDPLPAALPLPLALAISRVLGEDQAQGQSDSSTVAATDAASQVVLDREATRQDPSTRQLSYQPRSNSNGNVPAQPSTAPRPLHREPPSLTSQLNALFPTTDSLSSASVSRAQAVLRQRLEVQQRDIDRNLARLAAEQQRPDSILGSATSSHDPDATKHEAGRSTTAGGGTAGHPTPLDVEIAALLRQLDTIRTKAKQTEDVVKDITGEIRKLDMAKRNLVASMTALKRLWMLVSAVSSLSHLVSQSRFAEAASALQAVKSLQGSFRSYAAVERVARVNREVAVLEEQLEKRAAAEFEQHVMAETGRGPRTSLLADAAKAIDALGPAARTKLIDWYTAQTLREYRRIFRATDEAGQLDNVSRRYAWFRRILKMHEDERAGAFEVPGWDVGRDLTRRFAEATREDLKSALIREQGRLGVGVLLEALNSTLEFEAAMGAKFGAPFGELMAYRSGSAADAQGANAAAAAGVGPGQARASASGQSAPPPSSAPLSSTFGPYLSIFVDAQDKQLGEMMAAYRRQGPAVARGSLDGPSAGSAAAAAAFEGAGSQEPDDAPTVLPSSTELFLAYRQMLEQCAKLSNQAPFRELCGVFAKYLRAYADDVLRQAFSRPENAPRRSVNGRANLADVQRLCLLVNTADYCATTSQQLESKLRERIHPELAGSVSLEVERERFQALVSAGVQNLTRETELNLDASLQQMVRPTVPWPLQLEQLAQRREQAERDDLGGGFGGGFGGVNPSTSVAGFGDATMTAASSSSAAARPRSAFVDELASALEHVAVVVRQDVENKRYVRSWSDKVVNVVLTRFAHNIVRLKPLSTALAEQLLVDLGAIRTMLLELPRYSLSEERSTSAAASYSRLVNRGTSRLEKLLGVLGELPKEDASDDGGARALVRRYMALVSDRSVSNFQKVLELRGVRRGAEQNAHMDAFFVSLGAAGAAASAAARAATADEAAPSRTADGEGEGTGGEGVPAATTTTQLEETSFLTSLDMEPPANPSVSAFANLAELGGGGGGGSGRPTAVGYAGAGGPTTNASAGAAHAAAAAEVAAAAQSGSGVGGAGARAFSDLRRFGSLLVGGGRRDGSATSGR